MNPYGCKGRPAPTLGGGPRPLPSTLRAPDVLCRMGSGPRWLYCLLASVSPPSGALKFNVTRWAERAGVPRRTLGHWVETLVRVDLVVVLDPGGGWGKGKLLLVRRFANKRVPGWEVRFRSTKEVEVQAFRPSVGKKYPPGNFSTASGEFSTGRETKPRAPGPPRVSRPWQRAAMAHLRESLRDRGLPPELATVVLSYVGRGLFRRGWTPTFAAAILDDAPRIAAELLPRARSLHRGKLYAAWAAAVRPALASAALAVQTEARLRERAEWERCRTANTAYPETTPEQLRGSWEETLSTAPTTGNQHQTYERGPSSWNVRPGLGSPPSSPAASQPRIVSRILQKVAALYSSSTESGVPTRRT